MSGYREPDGAELLEQPGRCEAILRNTRDWRCASKEIDRGLCRLHGSHGARVPASWQHWRNPSGVIACKPIAPYRDVAPMSLAYYEQVGPGDRLTDGTREIVALGRLESYTSYSTDSYGRERPHRRWHLHVENDPGRELPLYIDQSALTYYELVGA